METEEVKKITEGLLKDDKIVKELQKMEKKLVIETFFKDIESDLPCYRIEIYFKKIKR